MSIQVHAYECVSVYRSLRFDELLLESKRLYNSPAEQKEFVSAALDADIRRSQRERRPAFDWSSSNER
jgi:hypothetical protein